MIKKWYFLFLLGLLIGCEGERNDSPSKAWGTHQTDKKVILIIVDSLLEEPLDSLMDKNELPAFQFLKDQGWYSNRVISSFPTMSVTIDSTILTGTYADKHRVPALRWFNVKENRLINYGDGILPILRSGILQTIEDSLVHLNQSHLSHEVLTIHEELAQKGKSSASINALVYRAKHKHTLQIPGMTEDIVTFGPPYMVLGSFLHEISLNPNKQYFDHYGINDHVSLQHLIHLIDKGELPPFTMVYFPDLDQDAHKHGEIPSKSVRKMDQMLQEVLDSFGSWEEAIEKHVFIVMGDSGVSKIKKDKQEALIDLDQAFSSYQIAPLGKSVPSAHVAIASNERMAYIYLLDSTIQEKEIVDQIKQDHRLDTISWKNEEWIEVLQGGSNQYMRFRLGSEYKDSYDQSWDLLGNPEVLDIQVNQFNHSLEYDSYPDGLMRLYSAAHSHEGRFLIVTAKPGYEIKAVHSPHHVGGGAHGSFHKEDSYFPMFIVGTNKRLASLRVVDLKSFILDVLGF